MGEQSSGKEKKKTRTCSIVKLETPTERTLDLGSSVTAFQVCTMETFRLRTDSVSSAFLGKRPLPGAKATGQWIR
jgi:hypothetical protein